MDVRCDRCQTEYELDEGRLTDAGVAVKCTNCGNVFKVRRVSAPPVPGGVAGAGSMPVLGAPVPPGVAPLLGTAPRVWLVRRYDGSTLTLNDLTDLQRAVVERQVAPDDGVSISGGAWHTLGSIPELASFFEVMRTTNRTRSGSFAAGDGQAPARATTGSIAAQAQGRTLTPVWDDGPSALGKAPTLSGEPAWVPAPPPPNPELEAMMEKEDSRVLRKGRLGRVVGLIVAAVLVGGGVTFYLFVLPGMNAPGTLPVAPIKPPDVNALPRPSEPPMPAKAQAPAPASPVPAPGAPPAPKTEAAPAAATPPAGAKIHEPKPASAEAAPGSAPASPGSKAEPAAGAKKTAVAEAPEAGGTTSVPSGRSFDYYIAQGHKLLDSKPSAALAMFEKAGDLDPKSPEPDSGRGLAYSNMEKLGDAAVAFQAALHKSSEFTEAILGLAEVSAQQGNRRKAIGLYQRYLDLTPDGPDAPAARAQLDELKAEMPAQPERASATQVAQPAAAQAAPQAPAPTAAAPQAATKPAAVAPTPDSPPPPPVVVPDTAPPAR